MGINKGSRSTRIAGIPNLLVHDALKGTRPSPFALTSGARRVVDMEVLPADIMQVGAWGMQRAVVVQASTCKSGTPPAVNDYIGSRVNSRFRTGKWHASASRPVPPRPVLIIVFVGDGLLQDVAKGLCVSSLPLEYYDPPPRARPKSSKPPVAKFKKAARCVQRSEKGEAA
jgi:hypothetical protein